MAEDHLKQRMDAYHRWKSALVRTIENFHAWLEEHGLDDEGVNRQLDEAREQLLSDTLTVACVAEFSRGKSELINALLHGSGQQRLLPSQAGRTTRCPTELFFDRESQRSYISLLPVETRLQDLTLAELKSRPEHWTTIHLDLESPQQMAIALGEVMRVKRLPLLEARRLGFTPDELVTPQGDGPPGTVEVPMWRHARISFPHPLLRQGLVILDTPGLNALGSEPELTLDMLPNAQAVLFVLAADAGVTRSEMEVWRTHILRDRDAADETLLVGLNKIDTLWDDLREETEVQAMIDEQVRETARLLGVSDERVFPVSAQKALLAKVRGDRDLLERSRMSALEDYLTRRVLPARQRIVRDQVVKRIGWLVENARNRVAVNLERNRAQLEEMRELGSKRDDLRKHLEAAVNDLRERFGAVAASYHTNRTLVEHQGKALVEAFAVERLDALMSQTRRAMMGSWTTAGLFREIQGFFDEAGELLQQAMDQARETRDLVNLIYRKFQERHGTGVVQVRALDLERHMREFRRLEARAAEFRRDPRTALSEQGYVTKRFFLTLVSKVRLLFLAAHAEAGRWVEGVMTPLHTQLEDQRSSIEARLAVLTRLGDSKETIDNNLRLLEKRCASGEAQLNALDRMRELIERPLPFELVSEQPEREKGGLRLVR
jgi:GTPase SAR1 family protein